MTPVPGPCKRLSGFKSRAAASVAIMIFAVGPGLNSALAQAQRVVSGKVLTSGGDPQANAIVYLQNDKSKDIKTFFSVQDGSYRFGQLSPDADYDL